MATSSGHMEDRDSGAGGQITTRPCKVCKTPCSRRCTVCFSVFYCSREHQKQDWKQHKTPCKKFWPLVKTEDETFGRYWVASRDIKAGELILKEKPVMWAPRIPPHTRGEVACIGTGGVLVPPANLARGLKGTPMDSCSKCDWPICALNCEMRPVHAKNECPIFTSGSVPFPPTETSIRSAYLGVGMLRLLLTKTRNPESWRRINDLQHEFNEVDPDNENFWTEHLEPSPDVLAARKALNVAPELAANDEEWSRIFRILKLNALNFGCCSRPHVSALFERASFFSHSCIPNANIVVADEDYHIHVRATTNIKKGEMITIGHIFYEDEHKQTYGGGFKGTDNRLQKTSQAGFLCKCPRCLDPTELGTYASAIMCARCRRFPDTQGIMLPRTFQDFEEPYRCLTPGCDNIKPRTEVTTLVERLDHELMSYKSLKIADRFENFIARNSGTRLHPNHWLIIKASLEWLFLYGRIDSAEDEPTMAFNSKNPEQPEKLLEHCRRVVVYMDKIDSVATSQSASHLYKAAEALRFNLEHRKEAMNLSREQEIAEWGQVRKWVSVSASYLNMDIGAECEDEQKDFYDFCGRRLGYLHQLAKQKIQQLRRSGSEETS